MSQLVCNFAPIRFLPYREIGEFVNVGVVLHCPQTDVFDFRLIPSDQRGRVVGFFPELDAKLFAAAIDGLDRELRRVRNLHPCSPPNPEPGSEVIQKRVELFREYVRRREGLLHFGETGSLLAAAPGVALDELFHRFVDRHLARRPSESQPVAS